MLITPDNTLHSQYQFSMIEPHETKHPLLLGGFGSGKTRSIPLRWLNLIHYRGKVQKKKCSIMIVEPTNEMIRDILVPTFNEYFDQHNIKYYYHKSNKNYEIRYRGITFTAMFRSSDNPSSLTGKNLTDIILDEFDKTKSIKDQRDIWKECIARVRVVEHGTVSAVTTPEGFKHTYELWGECDYKEKKNFKLIRAKTYDNKFLPKDYIENLYNQYSAELVDQYIEANFVNITQGKAYTFDRSKHVRQLGINYNLPLYFTFDFNINPMTTSVIQIREGIKGEQLKVVHIIKEFNTPNCTAEKQCLILNEYLKTIQWSGTLIITGDATKVHSVTSNLTNWEIVKYHFPNAVFKLRESNPAVIDRINTVNSKLKNSFKQIGLFVNEECKNIITDFEQVTWLEGKTEIDKRNKDRTHNTDNIGYLIWNEFSFIRPNVVKISQYA